MDGITIQNTERLKSYPAYSVPISKVPEERQLDGMIKEINQEESMK